MAVIGRNERRQSGLLSFADLIRLSSVERGQSELWSFADLAVQIEMSRVSSMSFICMSICHPITLFLFLHRT